MIGAEETSVANIAGALQQVTLAVGLTMESVLEPLMAGIKVTDLLDYADAVACNRLN